MRGLAAALVFFVFLAPNASAATQGRTVTLSLPHPLHPGETPVLQVAVGIIPKGAEIEITTPQGQLLGNISPYGIRSGREAGTYQIPLPADITSGSRVVLRLSLHYYEQTRAPTAQELKSVRVKILSAP